MSERRRIGTSIFARLLAVMVAMALAVPLAVGIGFLAVLRPALERTEGGLLDESAELLAARDLDLPAARAVAARYDLGIRYRGPRGAWTTDERVPALADAPGAAPGAAARPPGCGGACRVVVRPDGGAYLFASRLHQRARAVHDRLVVGLIVVIVLLVVAAHEILRRGLAPLRSLRRGVVAVAGGDLEVTVPRRSDDELGELADAFNRMVERVREMVRSRDQLLLDVSHELRSPLTRMRVALALWERAEGQADEPASERAGGLGGPSLTRPPQQGRPEGQADEPASQRAGGLGGPSLTRPPQQDRPEGQADEPASQRAGGLGGPGLTRPPQQDDPRRRMERNVAEMEAMVTELLDLERLRAGGGLTPGRHDLVEIVRDAVLAFGDRPPGVVLGTAPAERIAEVDPDRIRSVLNNLLENALRHSRPGGGPVRVSVEGDGPGSRVRVEDDGPGIPPEDLPRIYEPFFRVDRSRSRSTGGYGLGLALCRRIMEAHGGAIEARNRPGGGAEFTLTFRR